MNEPLDASYLLESYGGHLMPGGFLTAWLLTKVAVYHGRRGPRCCWPSRRGRVRDAAAAACRCSAAPPLGAGAAGGLPRLRLHAVGRHLVRGRDQPAADAGRPGLRAARARRVPAAPADPLTGWAMRGPWPGWCSTRRRCCCSASTRSSPSAGSAPVTRCTGSRQLWSHYRAGVLAYGALGRRLPGVVRRSTDWTSPPATPTPSRGARSPRNLVGITMLPGARRRPTAAGSRSPVGAFARPAQVVVLLVLGRGRGPRRARLPHPHPEPPGLDPARLHRWSATWCCWRRRAPTSSAPTSPASTATRPSPRRCS